MEKIELNDTKFSSAFYYDENNQLKGNVSSKLEKNMKKLEDLFTDSGDVIKKKITVGQEHKAYVMYVDGLADSDMIEDFVLRPLKSAETFDMDQMTIENRLDMVDFFWTDTLDQSVVEMLSGNTTLYFDRLNKCLVISSKKFPIRSVPEVESEKTMRGSKDAFIENLRTNTALLRRRVRDGRMKVKQVMVGDRSRTHLAICYVEGLVRPEWLKELEEKLNAYEVDAIYDSGMLEQLIEPSWKSPFPQFQYTERPDKAASAMLEGRVVVIVDNSPDVLMLPATANTFFQAADDYYSRHFVAQFARLLRYLAAFLAVGLPALYLSVISYHTEILPVQLILTIAKAREAIPFPAVVEVLLMELEFELLKEAGVRFPSQMGNTIGVVGGLIVGQAAVEAGLVSTIVVIVVALTAIASFAIPNEGFSSAFRIIKFFMIFLAAIWGIYGFFIGMTVVFIHLASLESMGIPYMLPAVSKTPLDYDDSKDFLFKKPIFAMRKRPIFANESDRYRMRKK